MTRIAKALQKRGYILRSGGADGADEAFEVGAGDQKEIYLPWRGFNGSDSPRHVVTAAAIAKSLEYHPAGQYLKPPVQKIMGRNAYQVLGEDLNSPSEFVVCWTPFGIENIQKAGGTGQALRIALDYGIPIFNLREADALEQLKGFINERRQTSRKDA
jgi:hypothetical protein